MGKKIQKDEAEQTKVAKRSRESDNTEQKQAISNKKSKKDNKKKESSSESSSSESSSSEEEVKKKADKKVADKKVADKKVAKKKESSSESSSSSSSSSEEEKKVEKKSNKKEDKKKVESSDESSSEEEEKKTEKKVEQEEDDDLPAFKIKTNNNNNNNNNYNDNSASDESKGASNLRLFLGNLSFSTDESSVKEFFGEEGVEKVDFKLNEDGTFYGTAFVNFKNQGAYDAALALNGQDFLGRRIRVEQSNNQGGGKFGAQRGGRGGFGGDRGGRDQGYAPRSEKEPGCNTIFVGNLSFNVQESDLTNFFGNCGEIAQIRYAEDRETGKFKGSCWVQFADESGVDKSVELAGNDLAGRPVRIDYSNSRSNNSGGGDRGRGGRGGGGRGGGRGGRGGGRGGFGGGRGRW